MMDEKFYDLYVCTVGIKREFLGWYDVSFVPSLVGQYLCRGSGRILTVHLLWYLPSREGFERRQYN